MGIARVGPSLIGVFPLRFVGGLHLFSREVTIGERRCRLWGRATAAAALQAAGISATPGDLYAFDGRLLRPGGGLPPRVYRGAQQLALTAPLHRNDRLCVFPAADLREPIYERVHLFSPPRRPAFLEPAIVPTQRLRRGLVSGLAQLEVATVLPTVPARAAPPGPPLIALTFDDGPSLGTTSQILNILARQGARATFFVVGERAQAHRELLQQLAAEGHEIGLHSWRHQNYTHLGTASVRADLRRCRAMIEHLTGQPVRLVRPPYGAINGRVRAAIAAEGLRPVLWTGDTNDWRRPGANTIFVRLLQAARPGAIILCHDGGGERGQTVAAIARAVPALQARGFQLVTVSELLARQGRREGGALLLGDGQWLEIKPVEELRLYVDGEPLGCPTGPAEMEGQLLVPVRPFFARGVLQGIWHPQAQALTLKGPLQQLTLRVNSIEAERGPMGEGIGRPGAWAKERLPVPPVLYRDTLFVPLAVIMAVGEMRGRYDPRTRTLYLYSWEQLIYGQPEGWPAPPHWGQGVRWDEYFRLP